MTIQQSLNFLKNSIYTKTEKLKIEVWVTPEPVSFEERFDGRHQTITPGDKWGSLFDSGWFHFTGHMPKTTKGSTPVLLIDINGELLLFDVNGKPLRGLTSSSSTFDRTLGEPVKRVFRLPLKMETGDSFEYWGDAGCNDLFGELKENGILKQADIAICRKDIRSLYYDYEFLINWMENIPRNDHLYERIKSTLQKTSDEISDLTETTILKAGESLKDIFPQLTLTDNFKITAIGHSHLDLAWLWPIRETKRKIARTLSTVFELMDRYPDYVYAISQPQLLQWVKEDYPDLFFKVKEKIKAGRIEALGAMWVESDTNLPSGESLIRQIIYGKKFWREEFSIEVDNLWLPDVFGYSGALPQILKQTGIKYFSTMKLSWNTINKFPYHSFSWKGIDGSSVLAHMLPEETYNSPANPGSVLKIIENYHEKNISNHALMAFGIGDGGGGPGAEHLERLNRMKNLGDPDQVTQKKVSKFFTDWASESDMFPVWGGELYLEKHQGTYTTESLSKWYNRKLEINLRKMEIFSVLTMIYPGQNLPFTYPADKLEELWKEVLLYQFHDILPGSSIKRVYEESWIRYENMLNKTKKQIETAGKKLVELSGFTPEKSYTDDECTVMVVNSLSWNVTKWISIKNSWAKITIPPVGFTVETITEEKRDSFDLKWDSSSMENKLVSIKFAENGTLQSVFDKENQREVLSPGGSGNLLAVYEDKGDAWDFLPEYRKGNVDQFTLLKSTITRNGPELINHQVYKYKKSILEQKVVLTADNIKIDFHTEISWGTRSKMVRTSFPVNVPNGKAMCEIQFGAIERPMCSNTSWDKAKDEVSAHNWIDISNNNYGVALLNDSKYGHRVKEGTLDLTLLRSVPYPGPLKGFTDTGKHNFKYSLYPHKGNYGEGGVVQAAYELNSPPEIYQIRKHENTYSRSFFSIGDSSLIISAIKKAENSADIIVRLYESSGKKITTWIESEMFKSQYSSTISPVQASLVNLLEEFQEYLEIVNNRIVLEAKPYEIISIRLSCIN